MTGQGSDFARGIEPLGATDLHNAWTMLQTRGPGDWLKTNLLVITAANANSPEPNTINYYLTGEMLTTAAKTGAGRKFKLGPIPPQDPNFGIVVQVHFFRMLEGPAARYTHTNQAPTMHLDALALTNTPTNQALVITGQLTGCTVAVGSDAHGTIVTHYRPSNGYGGNPSLAPELQTDIQTYGELVAARTTRVTHTFGKNDYSTRYATVMGQFSGGRWTFFAQKYADASTTAPPYQVMSFAADRAVHEV
eukprot:TRINITY_DN18370_c0_g1_i1.p1 TRINITY_DN18370_c0_g1~~TRINITY_DN18370_c0_g1_i1.p1  ORF type:complete len:249 (-),score=19.85 TRINITY_DN18370_c0_g1_i1:359-1105(-)